VALKMSAVLTETRASKSNNNSNVANVNASNHDYFPAPSRLWQPPTNDWSTVDKMSNNGAQKNNDGSCLPLTETAKRRTSKNVRPTTLQPYSSSDSD